tara:strand:- start:21803 stop:23581 length:1779 start_codon:yes stop_codon:yes gene_type:complete
MVKDDDKQEEAVNKAEGRRRNSITQKLTAAMTANVPVMGQLISATASLHKAQSEFSKVLITTGNKQLGGIMQLHKTFDHRGLSLQEAIAVNTGVLENGLASYDKNTRAITDQKSAFSVQKKLLTEYTNLGKDTKGLTKLLASNQQVLGISTSQTAALTEHTVALGATYGFNSDKLVNAITSLAKTWVDSAGTFGKDITAASQKAVTTMIAEYGPAAAGQIQNLANTLLNGSQEASVAAVKLGIDLSKLFSSNAEDQVSALKQGLANLRTRMAGIEGVDAGFIAQKLAKSLGANPGMLALSKMEPLSRKMLKTSLAQQAEDARRNNALASINEAVKNIVITLLPAIQVLATVLSGIAKVMSVLKYQVSAILLYLIAKKVGQMAKNARGMMPMLMGGKGVKGATAAAAVPQLTRDELLKKHFPSGKGINNAGGVLSSTGKPLTGAAAHRAIDTGSATFTKDSSVKKAITPGAAVTKKVVTRGILGRMFGVLGRVVFGLPGMIAMMVLPGVFSMFSSSKKDANDNAKKTHELLDKPASKQETHLASIVRTLNQNNIYQEQLILQSQESTDELRKSNDPKQLPPSRTFDMPARSNI